MNTDYLPAILITLAIIVVVLGLMALGWRNRLKRQADVPAPPVAPATLSEPLASGEGTYITTTTAHDYLDRIAVHGLGIRTNAKLSVHSEGVLLNRDGAAPVFIPAASLRGVRLESGMAGKFVEKEGLIVIEWNIGAHEGIQDSAESNVDTGFRARYHQQQSELFAAIESIAPHTAHNERKSA